jgi:two-component system, sensor histidine kinase and response regulator
MHANIQNDKKVFNSCNTLNIGSILAIDDDSLVLKVLSKILKSKGYNIYSVINPVDAFDIIDRENLDLILCDVRMPEMDGRIFHRSVRNRPELIHIPFIYLTGVEDETLVKELYDNGADEYLLKPCDPERLINVVNGKIERSRQLRQVSEAMFKSYRKKTVQLLSHEFRTPLVSISTGSELLESLYNDPPNSNSSEKIKKVISAIRRGAIRLESLVNDFMLMQQLESGTLDSVFHRYATEVSICSLAEAFYLRSYDTVRSADFTIKFIDYSNRETVVTYDEYVWMILDRLLSNAIKFSNANKPEILIEVRKYDNFGAIEIHDFGNGIEPQDAINALHPFVQIKRDSQEQQGKGLGLSIANQLAMICNGRVELVSRVQQGTCARLLLPITDN